MLALRVDEPAVGGAEPRNQVQPEAAVGRIAVDGGDGPSVGRGIDYVDEPALSRHVQGYRDGGAAVAETVGGEFLKGEKQAVEIVLVGLGLTGGRKDVIAQVHAEPGDLPWRGEGPALGLGDRRPDGGRRRLWPEGLVHARPSDQGLVANHVSTGRRGRGDERLVDHVLPRAPEPVAARTLLAAR